MAAEASSIINVAAVSRSLQLGMLYDLRSDAMIPGVTLWDKKTIEKDVCVKKQPKTDIQIIVEDSIEDKTSALHISASLKASILGGMVELSGAAKYLTKRKTSKKQTRVTLKYSTTTKFEQLTMTHLGRQNISYPELFEHNVATHVVTAVQYGAEAFFVFDRNVSSSEKMKDIQGELKGAIDKIPTVAIGAQGDVTISQDDRSKFEKFSCMFHGDFALTSNPSTYEEAINIYKSLPSLLGENGEHAVPLMVWLYPLSKLDSRASQLVRSISSQLIEDAQAAMEELHEFDMECNDMLSQTAAVHFSDIRSTVVKLKNLCRQYRITFQEGLARVLPAVRGGREEESALKDILITKAKSPFSTTQLNEFMKSKKNEVNFISGYMDLLTELKAVKIVTSQLEMNQVLRDLRVELVISLMFTSPGKEEPFLSELNSWLREGQWEPTRPIDGEWFNDADVNQRSRARVNEFMEFTRLNASNKKMQFVVSLVPDPSNPGVSIYFYERGDLKDKAFHPQCPDTPVITQISHDRVQVTCAPLPGGTDPVLNYRVEYRIRSEESWSSIEGEDTSDRVTVTGLRPNNWYQFRQLAVLLQWVTLASKPTHMIKTLPCSPPEKMTGQQNGPGGIALTWCEPGIIGAGIRISAYKVEFTEESTDTKTWKEQLTAQKLENCTIEGMNPKSSHRFRVSAICGNSGSSAPSVEYVLSRGDGNTTRKKTSNRRLSPEPGSQEIADARLSSRRCRAEKLEPQNTTRKKTSNRRLSPEPGSQEIADARLSSRRCRVEKLEPGPGVWIRLRELRILLLGKSGAWKSDTVNTILGRDMSEPGGSAWSVCAECQRVSCDYGGTHVTLIDIPGLFNSQVSGGNIMMQVVESLVLSAPGPHAIILGVEVGRFTTEEWEVVGALRGLFGPGAERHTMVLFPRSEDLEDGSIQSHVYDPEGPSNELLKRYWNCNCTVNKAATAAEKEQQRQRLFDAIIQMVEANNGEFYRQKYG